MRIDSHQHFWRYDPEQYPWIQPDWPIRQSYLPRDLTEELAHFGISGTVAVQARQCLDENRFLLGLADIYPVVKGVVGWVDLRSADVEQQLAEFAPYLKFVGVRHVVQDEPDDNFMLGEAFLRGIAALRQFQLTYDILIVPRQIDAAVRLVQRFPEQPFVLDHIAKPAIYSGKLSPWREGIRELARFPNVYCKVSGMVTETSWSNWKAEEINPYLDVVFEDFGPQRLMFGSDWPVCLLAANYEQVFEIAANYISPCSAADEEAFFGGNAARFYGLDPAS